MNEDEFTGFVELINDIKRIAEALEVIASVLAKEVPT